MLVAPACSLFGTAPAATVQGVEITTDEIDDEIQVIRSNQSYTEVLEQTYGAPTQGAAGEGTFDAAFVAQILSLRVWYQTIENELEDRDLLPIPDELVDAALANIEQQFQSLGPDVFADFPEHYRDQLVEQQALIRYVERLITEEIGDDEEAFFDENPDEFAEICVSHALVGLTGGRTPADAEAAAAGLRARVEAGEDFVDIATNESEDPGAAAEGGALGCGSRLSLQFDETFEAAAFALEPGVVSEPVQTQFGSHLILVTERTVPDYDDVAADVAQVMAGARDARINEYIIDTICEGDVSVNPRYGTWTEETCDGLVPTLPNVQPPDGPRVTEQEGLEFDL